MNHSITIASVLPMLALLLGGGIGVSVVSQLIKRVFGLKSSVVIHSMVIAVSILASAAQYVMQYKNLPTEVLGITAPAIYGFSQGLYNSAKYMSGFLSRVQATYSAGKQVQSVATPVKVTSTTTSTSDLPADTTVGGFNA